RSVSARGSRAAAVAATARASRAAAARAKRRTCLWFGSVRRDSYPSSEGGGFSRVGTAHLICRGRLRRPQLLRGRGACDQESSLKVVMAARSAAGLSGSMALLVLLAGAAPAGVVAAQLLLLGNDPLLRDRRHRAAAVAAEGAGHRGGGHRLAAEPGGGDGVGAGERLVLVRHRSGGAVARLEARGALVRLALRGGEQGGRLPLGRRAPPPAHGGALPPVP